MTQNYKKITLTGKVYIKYIDDHNANIGDIRLYLFDDNKAYPIGDYENTHSSGYLKGEVFDGKFWKLINLDDFLENREYKFSKKERALDVAMLCKEILEDTAKGTEIYRTYRGHFSIVESEADI